MDKMKILKLDGCTTAEAAKALEKGAIIYDDFEKNIETYLAEWGLDESEKQEYRQMVKSGAPVEDWGIVKEGGFTYYIQYVN